MIEENSNEEENAQDNQALAGQVDPMVMSLLNRLHQLTRYDIGTFDEGGGYMCMYQDISQDGCWIRSSDVDDILRYFDL